MTPLNRSIRAIGTAVGLSVALTTLAQNESATTTPDPDRPSARNEAQTQAGRDAIMRDLRVSELIGMDVRNAKGDDLGKINDVVLDVNNNRVHYAILSFGGFAGLGDKLFAYPVRMFQLGQNERSLMLNVSEEQLENAPDFENPSLRRKPGSGWSRKALLVFAGPRRSPGRRGGCRHSGGSRNPAIPTCRPGLDRGVLLTPA
ncbi:MAG: PRC-barrel domain-containing protein [Burkholderiales bacterium]|nr:PRC-barrel domain-containing protein [Burkholderiales bacterium]